jgi:PBSX family phage terminase large subunit
MLKKIIKAIFKFKPFSMKQLKILTWWLPESPVSDKDGIIADGAIRSGKTLSMSLSFIMWAMETFEQQNFGMCGKTIGSFRRNVLFWLKLMLRARGYKLKDHRADNLLVITKKGKTNYFYIFGGKDEGSQDLIQGITLAGVFFDEVALMPESFVKQATGRCSVDGSKYWFNCNPDGPYHFVKKEYIDKSESKNFIYLHFTMDDNLSLSERIKERYRRMYTGVFYQRYILGLWVMAEGVIYSMFDSDSHIVDRLPELKRTWIGVDHGTSNATTFILCGLGVDNRLYVIDEYYHSGKKTNVQKSPSAYSDDFKQRFMEWEEDFLRPTRTFVDPAALAFMTELWSRHKIPGLSNAVNDVKTGIELVQNLMNMDMFRVHKRCVNVLRELNSYVWDPKAQERGEDKPIKQNDHCLDSVRYIVNSTAKLWRDIMKQPIAA